MTRFARAKGSKASNQRIPEEATSWQEMKQGMPKNSNKRIETLEDESTSSNNNNKTDITANDNKGKEKLKSSTKWSEFPILDAMPKNSNQECKSTNKEDKKSKINSKKKDKRKVKSSDEMYSKCDTTDEQNETSNVNNEAKNEDASGTVIKKKKKKSKINTDNSNDLDDVENTSEIITKKIKKRKRNVSNPSEPEEHSSELPSKKNKKNKLVLDNEESFENDKKSKKKKLVLDNEESFENDKKSKKKKLVLDNEEAFENDNNAIAADNKHCDMKKEKDIPAENKKHHKQFLKAENKETFNKKFLKENKSKEDYKRRKSQVNKILINGNEVEISYCDGFPVKKEDAERLKNLKKEMISRGLPRSEIAKALKLERRKAEKALAREKKKVCFNCRNSGHTLSECPSLRSGSDAQLTETGICFKCGSTEHTHFECKVTRGDNFKFAQCFICKEQGHIARQCPDNNKGLYPKGGACRVCGDVTHLKKDCPKYQSEQEENKVFAHTIDDQNIESLGNETVKRNNKFKNSQKIIKF